MILHFELLMVPSYNTVGSQLFVYTERSHLILQSLT